MKCEKLIRYSDEKFRQITGVKRATFEKMLKILKESYQNKHKNRGRHSKLTIEEMLLSTLEYLREYRTYAHIAANVVNLKEANKNFTLQKNKKAL